MLHSARSHGRALHALLQPRARLNVASNLRKRTWNGTLQLQQRRHWTKYSQQANKEFFEDKYAVATALKDTGVFSPRKDSGRKKKGGPTGDGNRVNIVNSDLAKDVVSYIKPSLERHKGCDLISVYPGVGLFAKALHDAVEPRSHLLLEPDEALYTPFLQPLLKKENVRLIPKSGIIWQELQEVLTPEYLPEQVEFDRLDLDKDPPRNDTLLIDMNLAMYPKKRYKLFDSMSRMIFNQLTSAIRTSGLFQKYGQVRMLIWIPDEEKSAILPRLIQTRKKGAIETELLTEYVAEVCGKDGTHDEEGESNKGESNKGKNLKTRPKQLDFESLRQALVRMRDGGYVPPQARETKLLKEFKEAGIPLDTPLSLTEGTYQADKAFSSEVEYLRKQWEAGLLPKGSKLEKRYSMLRHYVKWIDKIHVRLLDFMKRRDAIEELSKQAHQAKADGDDARAQELLDETRRLNDEYNDAIRETPDYLGKQIGLLRDQMHILRQPPELGPVLSWDRRPWEPLKVSPAEFFPNAPCALIDVQPKAPHPLLRHVGPGTSNAGDIFDMMLSMITQNTLIPLVQTMDHVWPGAREGLEPECEALRDPARGGTLLTGEAAVGSRTANEVQLLELLEKFIRWPFAPSYYELVGRLEDDNLVDDASAGDDDGHSSLGMGNTTMDPF